jgi:hypothetical protein
MSNQITSTTISAQRYVSVGSRYANGTVIYYGPNNIITFTTYKRGSQALSNNDRYAVVTKGVEFRPDLASYQFYGAPDFWWRILEANGMMDVMEFKAGVNIRLPDLLLIRT